MSESKSENACPEFKGNRELECPGIEEAIAPPKFPVARFFL
ncbi:MULTISPECIES: hypothetical protein [unclassified Phormidesmis]